MLWCVCVCVLLLVLGYFQICVKSGSSLKLNGKGAVSSLPRLVIGSMHTSPQTLLGQRSKRDVISVCLLFPINLCPYTTN